MRKMLGRGSTLLLIVLVAVMLACVAVAWVTNDAMANLPFLNQQRAGQGAIQGRKGLVDLSPWQTAQVLAGLAVTAEESEYAREAERLADHEVDQAFAAALRQAAMHKRVLTGDALALSQKVAGLEQNVKDDQAAVQKLTNAGTNAGEDLDVAKAQLGLDSDELADAQLDLARATGDERTRIQQELTAHEATMKEYDSKTGKQSQTAVTSAAQYGNVARRVRAWLNQTTRYRLIEEAMQQASAAVATLTAQHNQLRAKGTRRSHRRMKRDWRALRGKRSRANC